jgi:hypothetical protein|tara:strand:- start:1584 stop:1730 length:147 start_codon:yes stop_codon:yes gene_type:complete
MPFPTFIGAFMPRRLLLLTAISATTGLLMLSGCSPIPDMPGPIGIPGL